MSFYATPYHANGMMVEPHTITFAIAITDDEAFAFNAYDDTFEAANRLGPKMWQCGETAVLLNTSPEGCRFYFTRKAIGITDSTLHLYTAILRDHLDQCLAKAKGKTA